MANTYTQLYIQVIFTVQERANLIKPKYRVELEKYISGILKNKKSKLLAIYANPDHIHIFFSINPDISISNIVKEIKANSSKWINQKNWFSSKFRWQEGYGAFSYSKSQIHRVVNYILNQPEHHKIKTFKEEYIEFLEKFGVDYNEKYLFQWIDLNKKD